ncbi:MAG: protein translocase subunit SecF [Clostridiales bacterium]|nr:protein translocase subunit SecF [Clostridiales bacterium]
MNIIKNKMIYFIISIAVILIGIGFMAFNYSNGNGLFNFDIQFIGGTSITANNLGEGFSNDDISNIISEVINEEGQVQRVGDTSVNIKTKSLDDTQITDIKNKIREKYGIEDNTIEVTTISATISGEMQEKAFLAVAVSCIAMLVYVSLRFRDFKIGASCIIALLHDALIVLACYAIFRIPLNNSFIAAILTVLGYSINASIVIFDRLRENKRRLGSRDSENVMNISIKQSIRRSLYTSLTTFFTILALYIFGVQSVKEFALPIVVGIICGTYSSVFLAGSLWYIFDSFKKGPKRSR